MSFPQGSGSNNGQNSAYPANSAEGVIPASFFDMPIDLGEGNMNMDYGAMSTFPMADIPTSDPTGFSTFSAQMPTDMPTFPQAQYQHMQPQPMPYAPSPSYPTSSSIKMEVDDPASTAGSSPMPTEGSTPKSTLANPKKPTTSKADSSAESKPKKSKKKPATTPGAEAAVGSSKANADSSMAKPKKASKKKAADKSKDASASATASPAPFITPASPVKDTKQKGKKGAAGSKAGGKAASKARSTTARSASRMSSTGRDAGTPATSRVGSQRPQDDANDEEDPVNPETQQGEEAEDEEVEADDGVEELGKDHFSTQEAIYAAQQRNMGLLSMVMDEDQLDRHMASRRGALNKTSVRKLVNHVLSQSVSQHVAMVVSGVAKIFVGEIVEKGKQFDPSFSFITYMR